MDELPVPSKSNCIVLHPLWDLRHAQAPSFVQALKLSFVCGEGKSKAKFSTLRKHMKDVLPTSPPPGPATFVVHCLEALVFLGSSHKEGLSHLLTAALKDVDSVKKSTVDLESARLLAAVLLYKAITGFIRMEFHIIIRIAVVFDIKLKDIEKAIQESSKAVFNNSSISEGSARALMEPFILNLIRMRRFLPVEKLLRQFDMQEDCVFKRFIKTMAIFEGQTDLAGQWAAKLGNNMLFYLVEQCTIAGKFKAAHYLVQRYHLQHNFPHAKLLYKQSYLLCKLTTTHSVVREITPRNFEYLETQEDIDKAMALHNCKCFEMKGIPICPVHRDISKENNYINLTNLISEDKVVWVDTKECLSFAEAHLSQASVVGIDCEWKGILIKHKEPNKVAILQIATPKMVFIFDLIRLTVEEAASLENCLKLLFCSPNILKLGYGAYGDFERLSDSYRNFKCFQSWESVLDLQKVAGKGTKGGLSGLAQDILGSPLDKEERMSDWEKRPLSTKQLHYAALDAFVLLLIFKKFNSTTTSSSGKLESDWERHTTLFRIIPLVKKRA